MKEKFERLFGKIDADTRFVFLITVVSTFFCHLFFFVNRFANEDDLLKLVVEENMLGTGRWMPGNIFSRYALPVVLFVLVIVVMGVISVLVNKMFKVKNRVYMVIISLFLCTFPVLAMSFGYTFMIERYSLGLLLSVVAVYLALQKRHWWLVGSVCLTLSMGYYQSYVTVSIALVLMLIVKKIIEDNSDLKNNGKYIFKFLVMGIVGVILYLVVTRIVCLVSGVSLLEYKGMDSLGSLPPLNKLGYLLLRTYGHVGLFVLGKRFFSTYWYAFIPEVLLVISNLVLIIMLVRGKKLKKRNVVLLIILLLLFPLGINLLDFLMFESTISSLNIYQFVFLYIMPFVLITILLKDRSRKTKSLISCLICVLASIVIWNNFSISNLYYMKISEYNKATEMLLNRIVLRVEEIEGYQDGDKVFIGIKDDININKENDEYGKYFLYDQGLWDRYIGFSTMDDYDDYKVHLMIENTTGIKYEKATHEERISIIESDEYVNMPSWPNRDCIKKIGNIIVIKIS